VVETTGVDPRNTSTPSDLIAIGRLAMANPALASIVRSESITVAPLGTLMNSNPVLGDDGINGIKTGTLEDSGANLLFSATVDVGLEAPLTVIGIVLGGSSQAAVGNYVRSVLASITSGFHTVRLVKAGEVFGEYTTAWDDTARAVSTEAASLLTWSDTPVTVTMTVDPVATAADGAAVGSITYTAGVRTVTVPLALDDAIDGPGGWWRLGHPRELLDW
jgi:D-alanyl-D-alanine carboxypeptidase (penicillin-binding protein 5/6)